MSKGEMICDYCTKPIAKREQHWSFVSGWLNSRGAKGFSLPEYYGRYMHMECMMLKKAGVLPGQMSIDDAIEKTISLDFTS